MKRFMKKRWHAIPVGIITVILLACLATGGAFAAYSFYDGTATVTVHESMTVDPSSLEVNVDLGPGESVELVWDITNNGSVNLFVEPSVSHDSRDSGNITTQWLMGPPSGPWEIGPGATDPTGVRPGGTLEYKLRIIANGSTTPDTYTFIVTFDRS